MAKRKTDTDIILYGAIGVASGFAINYIQSFFLWYYFRKESWNLYKKGVELYGINFEFWWEVQKIDIRAKVYNLTEEEVDALNNDLINNPAYNKATDKGVLEAESWYKENCKWLNKSNYFRQRYAMSNYALIIAGLLPLITTIKSKTLQYILYGGAISGLFNAVRYNIKSFNIYNTQSNLKIYKDILKIIDKKMFEAFSSDTGWAGFLVWSIYDLSEQNKEEVEK
jgi:hypothetical protein